MEREVILYLSQALKHLELFNLVHKGIEIDKLVDSNLEASHFILHSLYFSIHLIRAFVFEC